MLVYEKVAWYLNNTADIAQFSLGKEKYRLIKKGFTSMDEQGYTYGCVAMTHDFLHEFSVLYTSYITQKDNARVINLLEKYTPRIGKDDIYFAYIRDFSGTLLAGGIFVHKIFKEKPTLMLGFRASTQSVSYAKVNLGYYIESLFFDCGVNLEVEQFSRGRDSNGYGFLGSAIGLCLHKIQLHFAPFVTNKPSQLQVDEKTITKNCLFFVDPNESGRFDCIRLFLCRSDEEKYKDLLLIAGKRGLSVDIHYID